MKGKAAIAKILKEEGWNLSLVFQTMLLLMQRQRLRSGLSWPGLNEWR